LTKEELSEYTEQKKEIKLLEDKIKELNQREAYYSNDVVKGSSKHFPYTEHPVKIYGYDSEYEDKVVKSINRKQIRLRNLKIMCEEEAEKIFEFINAQKESRARQVLTYAFIDGKKQKDIAKIMHVDQSLVSLIITNAVK
jgi:DNA-directed RNA polymerase specialized sigma subunit